MGLHVSPLQVAACGETPIKDEKKRLKNWGENLNVVPQTITQRTSLPSLEARLTAVFEKSGLGVYVLCSAADNHCKVFVFCFYSIFIDSLPLSLPPVSLSLPEIIRSYEYITVVHLCTRAGDHGVCRNRPGDMACANRPDEGLNRPAAAEGGIRRAQSGAAGSRGCSAL